MKLSKKTGIYTDANVIKPGDRVRLRTFRELENLGLVKHIANHSRPMVGNFTIYASMKEYLGQEFTVRTVGKDYVEFYNNEFSWPIEAVEKI